MTRKQDPRIVSTLLCAALWTASGATAQASPQEPATTQTEDAASAGATQTAPETGAPDREDAPDDQALALKLEAAQHYKARRYFEASRAYEKLVTLVPQSAVAHALLGRTRLALGDRSEAIRSLQTAHELAPDNAAIEKLLERAEAPAAAAAKPAVTTTTTTTTATLANRSSDVRSDEDPEAEDKPVDSRILHGFRLGYVFQMNHDEPGTAGARTEDGGLGPSIEEEHDVRSPHQFLLGYELTGRLVGHSWLNVILVGNVSVAGLEQSRFFPMASGLIGFELDQSFQMGVGVNLAASEYKPAHMIMAAGWTPKVGSLYVPVHFFFVPDVDQAHRAGFTLGVNWQ